MPFKLPGELVNQLNRAPNVKFEPAIKPTSDPAGAAGYAVPPRYLSRLQGQEQRQRSIGVKRVLKDPLLQQKLADRVYELLLEDLRHAQERHINYGGRF